MKRICIRLWRDRRGGISALSTLFLYTILVLGMTVGIITLRDQIVQEYGDLAVALDHLDQSWEINGVGFVDTPSLVDDPDEEPAGLSVQNAPLAEGEAFP